MAATATLDPRRGYPAALLSAAVLSTTAIFIRYLTQTYGMPPLVLAFWRDGLVALTLLPVLALARPALLRLARRHLRYLIWYGLVLALFNAIWVLSVALNGAAIATVLVYSSAAFTVLLGRWFLGELLDWAKLLAVAFALGGCVLVAGVLDPGAWQVNPLGIVTGLVSGLGYAIYSLMGRSAAQRGLNPWTTLFYTFAFATGFLLAFNLLPQGILPGQGGSPGELLWLGRSAAAWIILFLLAAGPTVAGFGLYNVSLSLLPSSVANLILTSEPAFTALFAYLLLGERLTGVQIAGSLLILSGVLLLRLVEGRSSASHLLASSRSSAGPA
jgi:drug/metabolite transporter (DMT)-like permease